MKKVLTLALGFLLFGAGTLEAQTTAVTATVVDSDSTTWANAPWTLSFQVGPYQSNPANYTIGGSPLSPSVINQSGVSNGSGVISFTVYRSTAIAPIGSSWNLVICPNASVACTTVNFSTSTLSVDLSSQINAAISAPRFHALSGTYGYTDIEAAVQLSVGATYWNVTNNAQRCYTGSAWTNCNGGGGGGGTVTSVAMTVPSWLSVAGSPITTSGTLAVTAATGQTQNEFLATPNGSSGAVGLRAIVAADVPTLNQNTTGNAATATDLASYSTLCSGGQFSQGLSHGSNNCATPSSSGGTVTSVAMTMPGAIFNTSVSGSPITSSGTLAPSLLTQSANTVLAGPTTGSAATPTFRALVSADLPLGSSSQVGGLECGSGTTCSGGVISVSASGGTVFCTPNAQTGTSYTLVLGDGTASGNACIGTVTMTNASNNNVTVPPNSSVSFPVPDEIDLIQLGAGQTCFVAGSGVTLTTPTSLCARAENSTIGIRQLSANTWIVFGDTQ